MERHSTFIDLRCDFGFKHCMGDEIVMKSFLNAVLSEDYGRIESIQFQNTEIGRRRHESRGVTFDLRCRLADGSEVLVEMQNYTHPFFKTRANYYLYKLMDEHIPKGTVWRKLDHDIPQLIGIFIMGKNIAELTKPLTKTAEFDAEEKREFWDRMRKYYISLPHVKEGGDSTSMKEVWFDIFKNLGHMDIIDEDIIAKADEGLLQLIEKAKVAALSKEEYAEYEASLKILSDDGLAEDFGYRRGKEEGRKEGREEGREEGLAEGVAKGKAEGIAE
ncbi:MAG: Rpn family recombination-promoting nuclease/putative transposase, partial [Bacteroidales bacterium]|nr:Rpn family recombination-promoting nuclease/putative transposase [Bacteroidales bacterium]